MATSGAAAKVGCWRRSRHRRIGSTTCAGADHKEETYEWAESFQRRRGEEGGDRLGVDWKTFDAEQFSKGHERRT